MFDLLPLDEASDMRVLNPPCAAPPMKWAAADYLDWGAGACLDPK